MMVMLQRFWVQLTSDRKRFGLLCAVLAAGLLLWARLIIVSKVPRTAVADESPGLVAGTDEVANGVDAIDRSDNRKRETVNLTLRLDEARDPFLINPTFFPRPLQQPASIQEVGKSQAEPVENPEQEKARRFAQFRAHVERLSLDAAMTGQGMAVISGTLYRLNDMVHSNNNPNLTFKLIEVRARSVVLKHDNMTFELAMDAPGHSSP